MATSSSTLVRPIAAAHENWWAEVWAVFVKDVRSEFRTKAAVGSVLVFAITTVVLLSFLVTTKGPGLTQWLTENGLGYVRMESRAKLLSSLLWVVLYFSAMAGLPRVFAKEEEMRTAAALRLTSRPSAVFTGKLCFNVVLIVSMSLLVLPLFVLLFEPEVANWPMLLAHVIGGTAGMAAGATILGAMVARTSNRGYVMVVLGFGPLLPILILAINGTTAALYGSGGNNLFGIVSYLVVITILSAGLFEQVWRD